MNKTIESSLFPDVSSVQGLNFILKKERMIGFLLHEIKGIVDSMEEMSTYDENFDHPSIPRLQNKVNQAIKLITSVGESDSNEINFDK